MRKLATIRKISELRPIEGADAIECAIIDGWTVVVKKGEFSVGELVIYLEIDSWVPTEIAPFLSKGKEPREYNGIKGERLRTVKLRGQLSQGLVLPTTILPHALGFQFASDSTIGEDVSHWLGIQKYEAPINPQLSGEVRGNFPSFIPKTDQERIQNLTRELQGWIEKEISFEVTEKLDGSSMTVYVNGDDAGVCSRNLDLKGDNPNTFWNVARQESLIEKIRSTGRNLAFQGELIGPGIQGNRYNVPTHQFHLFDIYDIDAKRYLTPAERHDIVRATGVKHVPVIAPSVILDAPTTVASLLQFAEAKSILNHTAEREGVVYKSNVDDTSWKAISNKFLLKGGE